jgi:histidinol dehydrogenase
MQLADAVEIELQKQLEALSRKDFAALSLANSRIIVLDSMEAAIEATNLYAPEHLIISTKNYHQVAEKIQHAGSVFLGNFTPESAGDYASGTNHTLPTNGFSKMYSGVHLDSFRKKTTFQEITNDGLSGLAETLDTMAKAEFLTAHANAVNIRLNKNKSN